MRIDYKTFGMHRVLAHAFNILDLHSHLDIDRIDRNRCNNCIKNFRPATRQQNQFNRGEVKGYYWNKKCKKWIAQIKLNGKQIHIGCFDNEAQAHQAYLDAKEIYHKF